MNQSQTTGGPHSLLPLSLGGLDGSHALQLLRLGAKQVDGIDPDANLVKQGQSVTEAFEWADNRRYDLQYIRMDMLDLVMKK